MPLDYRLYNRCMICEINYPKTAEFRYCPSCGKPTRWKPSSKKDQRWEKAITRY